MPAADILYLVTLQLRMFKKCPMGKPFQVRQGGKKERKRERKKKERKKNYDTTPKREVTQS